MVITKTTSPTRTKYWSVPKGPSSAPKLRWQLDAVMAFAKCELTTQASDDQGAKIKTFAKFLLASDHAAQGDWGDRVLNAEALRVQQHLRERLDQITTGGAFGTETPLWKSRVVITFSSETVKGRFVEKLSLDLAKRTSHLNMLKAIVDLRLIELVRDLELKPQRFRHCDRCHTVFYQPTERVKNFCSSRCAGTIRQARYTQRKGKEIEKEKADPANQAG
jgi:hypothetical protein